MLCFAGDIPPFVRSSCDCEETDDGVKIKGLQETLRLSLAKRMVLKKR